MHYQQHHLAHCIPPANRVLSFETLQSWLYLHVSAEEPPTCTTVSPARCHLPSSFWHATSEGKRDSFWASKSACGSSTPQRRKVRMMPKLLFMHPNPATVHVFCREDPGKPMPFSSVIQQCNSPILLYL